MEKLLEILETHAPNYSGDECDCGWSSYYADFVLTYPEHLAEMLKPLLAEVWAEAYLSGHATGYGVAEFDAVNPYEKSK